MQPMYLYQTELTLCNLGGVRAYQIELTLCNLVAGRCSGCVAISSSRCTRNSSHSQQSTPGAAHGWSQDVLYQHGGDREGRGVM